MNGRARTGIRAHGRICAAITMLCTLPLVAAYQPRLPGLPALRTSVAASPAHSRTHAEASRRALGFREPHMKEEEPTSDDSTVLLIPESQNLAIWCVRDGAKHRMADSHGPAHLLEAEDSSFSIVNRGKRPIEGWIVIGR